VFRFAAPALGGYPHKTLASARDEAERLWAMRRHGIDPRAHREEQIQARRIAAEAARLAEQNRITLRALFDRWATTELQPRIRTDGKRVGRKDGGKFTRDQFARRVFPVLGDESVETIKKAELLAILDSVKAEGKARTANVLFTDLKQMFRFALARDIIQRNPLETVAKRDVGGTSVLRSRVLSMSELHRLAAALPSSGLDPRTVAALWLILSTGVRIGELMGAAWVDAEHNLPRLRLEAESRGAKLGFVDTRARKWRLLDTKTQREHTIHLSDFALSQFNVLSVARVAHRRSVDAVPWVFPNSRGVGPKGVKAFGKQLSDRQREPARRLRNRTSATTSLSMPGGRWTAHDLRRTAATLMAELGVSGDVIDECLNHVIESEVRRIYVRDRREPDQARAFDALGQRLSQIFADSSDEVDR